MQMMARVRRIPGGHLMFSLNSPPSWKRLERRKPGGLGGSNTALSGRSSANSFFLHHIPTTVPEIESVIGQVCVRQSYSALGDRPRHRFRIAEPGYCPSSLSYSTSTAQHGSSLFGPRREFEERRATYFSCSSNSDGIGYASGRPIQRMVSRNFGGSPPVIATTELDEDFELAQAKQVETCDTEMNDRHSASLRIEPLRSGILDRDLLRRRRTQPFSDQCWMRSLGVGLYRDKVRNCRIFNSIATGTTEEISFGELNGKIEIVGGECGIGAHANKEKESSLLSQTEFAAQSSDHDKEEDEETEDEEAGENSEWEIGGLEQHARGLIGQGVEDLEAGLKDLESKAHPSDVRIGMICLKLAQVCDAADEDPEKILSYGSRALRILGGVEESVQTAACLQVMGSAYYKLENFEKSLAELKEAARVLEKLEAVVGEREIGSLKHTVQFLLGHVKMALGMDEAALENYFESLYINERLLNPGDPDLAMSYQQVADACLELGHLEEAVTMCCKSLEIFQNFFGQNSTQAAVARKLLALIYTEMEEYEKVLQEHEKIRPVLEAQGLSKEIASLDLSTSDALIELGKYEEAIPVLQNVLKETKGNNPLYGSAMVFLAMSYANLNKGKDALKCCKKALNFLSKSRSIEAADSLVNLASVYEHLNEVDEAILIYKKALAIFEKNPDLEEAIADAQSQLGMLLLYKGKVDEAISYLKKAVAIFKVGLENEEEISEPEGTKLLALYNHLGIANIELENFDEAVETFEKARRMSLHLLGPDDPHTIAVYQNLVSTYPVLGRFDIAIEYQKHIIQSVKKLGEGALDPLEQVEKKLEELIEESTTFKMNESKGGN